jgi:DNA repair exonuclease SbcCD nuclease subunit
MFQSQGVGQNQSHITLQSRGDSSDFSFAIIGDRTGSGPNSWEIFSKTLYAVKKKDPDFTIFIGDIIEGFWNDPDEIEAHWEKADPLIKTLDIPFYLVPGNHDIWNRASYMIWKKRWENTYSHFVIDGSVFLILNSEERHGTGQPGFGNDQLIFIRNIINSNMTARRFFVFIHQPVWILESPWTSQWKEVKSWLKGKEVTVFAGHLHLLAEKIEDNIKYVIVGPSGGELRFPENPALGIFHHYTWVSCKMRQVNIIFTEPSGIEYSESIALKIYPIYARMMKYISEKM